VDGVYVAFDFDVLAPDQIACFMPEPGGISLDDGVAIVERVSGLGPVLGLGLTALLSAPGNVPKLLRVCDAAGLGE
jgi:arginase family enzyme